MFLPSCPVVEALKRTVPIASASGLWGGMPGFPHSRDLGRPSCQQRESLKGWKCRCLKRPRPVLALQGLLMNPACREGMLHSASRAGHLAACLKKGEGERSSESCWVLSMVPVVSPLSTRWLAEVSMEGSWQAWAGFCRGMLCSEPKPKVT